MTIGLPPRVDVLGVGVHALTMAGAVEAIDAAIRTRRKGYVCVTGVHGVMEAQADPALRAILNGSYLTTPDGMPMVWMGRAQGYALERVYGPALMLEVARHGIARGYRHFLYGGDVGVAPALAEALVERCPGVDVVGTYTPPFRPLDDAEAEALRTQVAAARPDVLWVGLSTPKQERFMAAFGERLDATVMVGVGAAFDIHTGRVAEAPAWMQRAGLQWLHRLAQEPRRLAPRYLRHNPRFIVGALAQLARRARR